MTYYRKLASDVWHFHEKCHHLKNIKAGAGIRTERKNKPSTGELCNECIAKAKEDK